MGLEDVRRSAASSVAFGVSAGRTVPHDLERRQPTSESADPFHTPISPWIYSSGRPPMARRLPLLDRLFGARLHSRGLDIVQRHTGGTFQIAQ